jgi:ionotropic glutamate receptor
MQRRHDAYFYIRIVQRLCDTFSLVECDSVPISKVHRPLLSHTHILFVSPTSGGLFDDKSEDAELVFKYAVQIMNNQRSSEEGRLQAITKRIEYGNEFQASKAVCRLMRKGVMGILHGPVSANAATHVQNICDAKEMPFLETRYDPYTEQPVINLHPHPSTLAHLYADLVDAFGWTSFTIVYESAPW